MINLEKVWSFGPMDSQVTVLEWKQIMDLLIFTGRCKACGEDCKKVNSTIGRTKTTLCKCCIDD